MHWPVLEAPCGGARVVCYRGYDVLGRGVAAGPAVVRRRAPE